MSIEGLLANQAALADRFKPFVSSLHKGRTATLQDVLICSENVARLNAPWLNQELFRRRIAAAQAFLENLEDHPRLPKRQRLTFFQSSQSHENGLYHRELLSGQMGFYQDIYEKSVGKGQPPEAWYFHTNPMWSFRLQGSWKKKNRTIPPLGGFMNKWGFDSEVVEGTTKEIGETIVLGLRVPHWPSMLGVSNDTATEYFARIVIHDLGHSWLPHLDSRTDSLHNAVMLTAANAEVSAHASLWERVVYRECTDPLFYVDGYELLRQCDELMLEPLQKYLLKKLRRYYDSKRHRTLMKALWGIDPEWPLKQQRLQLRKVVTEMCSDGFGRYNPDWKPPE